MPRQLARPGWHGSRMRTVPFLTKLDDDRGGLRFETVNHKGQHLLASP